MIQSSIPSKTPLYQQDQSIRHHETPLTRLRAIGDLDDVDKELFAKAEDATHVLQTEQTIFHPQGGGQPSDKGTMATDDKRAVFNVSLVRQAVSSADTILHAGSVGADTSLIDHFQPGTRVQQDIDSVARDLHSRIHTAGHLIGFAVHALREQIGSVGEGKASHYPGAASVEFIGKIAGEHKDAIQAKANEYVEQNHNVRIKFMDEDTAKTESTAVPDALKSDAEGWVRVMAIDGVGAYPCGE